jgi:hypothetical protein
MAGENGRLVARILLIGAGLLALLAALCWTGVLPIDHGARTVMTLAFGMAAVGDAVMALILLLKSQS